MSIVISLLFANEVVKGLVFGLSRTHKMVEDS